MDHMLNMSVGALLCLVCFGTHAWGLAFSLIYNATDSYPALLAYCLYALVAIAATITCSGVVVFDNVHDINHQICFVYGDDGMHACMHAALMLMTVAASPPSSPPCWGA